MSPNRFFVAAATALVIAGAASAQQISKPLSTLSGALAMGRISCHGYSNAPMTADQEQTLPMQLVRTLSCGEPVAVLADSEGYTVNIRTQDGKVGYVARMYLAKDTASPAPIAVSAPVVEGVARWRPGAHGSEHLVSNGLAVESITVNGVTVQVSLHDTGWKLRANIAVVNSTEQPLLVHPVLFRLEEHAPTFKSLPYQDPQRLAKAANHQILWTRSDAGVIVAGENSMNSEGNGGTYQAAAYRPSSPVYLAQQPAADNTARAIRATALASGTLKAGEKSSGAVWFERDARARELLLRIPVNDVVYEFPMSFDRKN